MQGKFTRSGLTMLRQECDQTQEVVGLLRNLHAQGFIERCEEKDTKAAMLGQHYVVVLWREVIPDGKN